VEVEVAVEVAVEAQEAIEVLVEGSQEQQRQEELLAEEFHALDLLQFPAGKLAQLLIEHHLLMTERWRRADPKPFPR